MKKTTISIILLAVLLCFSGCVNNDKVIENYDEPKTEFVNKQNTVIKNGDILYMLKDGVLYGKGDNRDWGILGKEEYYEDWMKLAENVKKFDVYSAVVMYLTGDGKVYGAGNKSGGVLQVKEAGDYDYSSEFILLFDDCKDISLGVRSALALKNDNTVWFWGESLNYQAGIYAERVLEPIQIADDAIEILAVGYTAAWIDSSNTLYMCGDNSYGQIGNGHIGTGFPTMREDIVKKPYSTLEGCEKIACSNDRRRVFAKTTYGTYYTWGDNEDTEPTKISNDQVYGRFEN